MVSWNDLKMDLATWRPNSEFWDFNIDMLFNISHICLIIHTIFNGGGLTW